MHALIRAAVAPAAAIVLGSLAPATARADTDVREHVAELLEIVRTVDTTVPSGDSPTAILLRLTRKHRRDFEKELQRLWDLARKSGEEDSHLRGVIEFAHEADVEHPVLTLHEGAVLVGEPPQREYDFGGFGPRPAPAKVPTYDEVGGGGGIRRLTQPTAGRLLDVAEEGWPDHWGERGRVTFVLALGEACGRTGTAAERLVELARRRPTDAHLTLALAWSGSDAAKELLTSRVASLSDRVAAGRDNARPLLRAAAAGLARLDREALLTRTDTLDPGPRGAVIEALGVRAGLPLALRDFERAETDEGRNTALRRIGALVSSMQPGPPAAPDDMRRLVLLLDDAADDLHLVRAATQVAEWLLFAHHRYPVKTSMDMNGIAHSEQGQRVGPYPDIETVLGHLAEAVREERARFSDSTNPRGGPPGGRGGRERGVLSDVPCPEPNRAEPHDPLSVRLTGELTDGTLTLSLANEGKEAYRLNPLALRCAVAEWTRITIEPEGGELREYDNLYLELGFLRARTVLDASALAELPPGETYSWEIPVRDEHTDAGHISVALLPFIGVDGPPDDALLASFPETWIR